MADTFANERDRHLFSPSPKRILALDGGGVRGMIALAYLERLEGFLRARHGTDYRLCDWFDLIGGTSTGSIIATGLALGMEASELIHIYLKLSAQGFKGSRWSGGYLTPKFKTKPLMEALRSQVGDITLGSEKLRTGLAIVAKRLDTGSVWIFHNNPRGPYFDETEFSGAHTPNRHMTLLQLIRASTAAPTFFAPERISVAQGTTGLFVDGGVSPHNNPALLLFMLATIKGYGFRWPTGQHNITLISVGTGHQPLSPELMPPSWKPSAMLAVLGLRSIIEDTSWLTQAMLQWMGHCPAPWDIDGEMGNLQADQLGPEPLLHYERYDVKLTRQWLAEKLSIPVSNEELRRLSAFDRPEYVEDLLKLGRQAAAIQMPSDTFD